MSKINVSLKDDKIYIHKDRLRKLDADTECIDINKLEFNKFVKSSITLTNLEEANKIFLVEKIDIINNDCDVSELENDSLVVGVYSTKNKIFYFYGTSTVFYDKVLHLYYKITNIKLTKRGLKINFYAYLKNASKLNIDDIYFAIGDKKMVSLDMNQFSEKISKLKIILSKNRFSILISMKALLSEDILINSNLRINLLIDNDIKSFNLKIRKIKNPKYYYVPLYSVSYNEYMLNIRRSNNGSLILLKREKDPYEYTTKYKILESSFVSCILYYAGNICKKLHRKNVNLYYEKLSEKAEEGTFELCKMTQDRKESKNYFIIDSNSIYYDKIKSESFVVKKYSFKYYWLIYTGDNCIATETPMHLNILRSNNKYLRKALYNKKFIFLQHGITYLKSQTNGAFRVGKEAEPDFMAASGELESDAICEQTGLTEDRILKTGLIIFDHVKYNHIDNKSDDTVMVMLTHKPYEEHLEDFKETSYYKNVIDVYNTVSKYVPKEKIMIVPHPKVLPLIDDLDIKNNFWLGPISEILEKSKLLITDYSSVSFNSFYQGAGVIFYQNDLSTYEANCAKLIPGDDEFIGYRAFDLKSLDELLNKNIKKGVIDIDSLRTKKFIDTYSKINPYHDGKNTKRTYDILVEDRFI